MWKSLFFLTLFALPLIGYDVLNRELINPSPYKISNGSVVFSGNRHIRALSGVDRRTFRYLGGKVCAIGFEDYYDCFTGVYAKDDDQVFYNAQSIDIADLKSFKYLEGIYALDRKAVYYGGMRLEGADWPTLRKIGNGRFFVDAKAVYFMRRYYGRGEIVANADPDSFVVIDDLYAKDNGAVYYFYEIEHRSKSIHEEAIKVLEDADPATFTPFDFHYGIPGVLGEKVLLYAKDKNSVYRDGQLLAGRDADSFHVLSSRYSADRYQVYLDDQVATVVADPGSFKLVTGSYDPYSLDAYYSKDAKKVYHRRHDSTIEFRYELQEVNGADPDSFEVIDPNFPYYGRDQYSVYRYGQRIPGANPKTF